MGSNARRRALKNAHKAEARGRRVQVVESSPAPHGPWIEVGDPHGPWIEVGDRIVFADRRLGVVKAIDTSAQRTARGRAFGWPFAAWVLFDDRAEDPEAWSCVNAFECHKVT